MPQLPPIAPGLLGEPPTPPTGGGAVPPGLAAEPPAGAAAGRDGGDNESGADVAGPAPATAGSEPADRALPGMVADAAALPQFGSPRWVRLAAWGAGVSTTAGTMTAFALFALRRRRETDQPEPPNAADTRAPTIAPHLAGGGGEDAMPRWRRPSLIAARRAAPLADPGLVATQRLTFERSPVERDGSLQLRWVRYRMVRLSDAPDELLSTEIARLDAGDEVELLTASGVYWQVRTPAGDVGWVHRMTLADVAPADAHGVVEPPAAGMGDGPDQAVDGTASEGLAARLIRERAASA